MEPLQMNDSRISEATSSKRGNPEERLLVGELTHRMNNEFAAAIAVVSLAAARSPNGEVKSVLSQVEERLHSYAQVNRCLQIPLQDTLVDASAHIGRLCQSIGRSRLDCRGIELQFVGRPIQMNSERCWRLGMIISELITNAARHAFGCGGGKIQVELFRSGSFVCCRVSDDGTAPEKIRPGRGSAIMEGLIASLDGTINHHFGPAGTVSDMIFPVCSRAQEPDPSALFPPKGRDTVLRVGPLELDLIVRNAKRDDRPIDLQPREFLLLRYMMKRSDQVLTRATLFKEVWHYKFVPESNLVDVHMGRLRRKVDGAGEAPMIRTLRGAGFILSATSSRKVFRDADSPRI
jgi:two-component sensor histidine kinase/DNA-binding winged helix-turn-helix (wHTH) protein